MQEKKKDEEVAVVAEVAAVENSEVTKDAEKLDELGLP
jgi:hypothetical protein